MQNYLLVLLIIILTPIIIEDFKHRKISLLWIMGIVMTGILQQVNSPVTLSSIVINTLINFSIILLNYGILTLYFSLRNRKIVGITNEHLGIGDIAFLLAVAFLFSPVNFICFLLFSLLFSLLFTLFGKLFLPTKFTSIPLAGLQAFFLAFILLTFSFQNKTWTINNDDITLSIILNYAGIS